MKLTFSVKVAAVVILASCDNGTPSPFRNRAMEAADFSRIHREGGFSASFETRGGENEVLVYMHDDCTPGSLAWLLSIKNLRLRIKEAGFTELRCSNWAATAKPPWDETARQLRKEAIDRAEGETAKAMLRVWIKE
jgi:hypothetical protein